MCYAPFFYGAVWNPDNTIVYADSGAIRKISIDGRNPETLLDIKESGYPQILPDGKRIIFTVTVSQPPNIVVYIPEPGEQKKLFIGSHAKYLPTGHLVYLLENTVLFH